jgi:hypothetical protein
LIESTKICFELFLEIKNITTEGAWSIDSFPCLYFKFSSLPKSVDFLSKLSFETLLFIG